jgi:hypothetical protein
MIIKKSLALNAQENNTDRVTAATGEASASFCG